VGYRIRIGSLVRFAGTVTTIYECTPYLFYLSLLKHVTSCFPCQMYMPISQNQNASLCMNVFVTHCLCMFIYYQARLAIAQ
jgi:hypothetical protein